MARTIGVQVRPALQFRSSYAHTHRLTRLINSGKRNVDKCFRKSGSGTVRRFITVGQEGTLDGRGGWKIGGRVGRCGPAEDTLGAGCEERFWAERQTVSRSVRKTGRPASPSPASASSLFFFFGRAN